MVSQAGAVQGHFSLEIRKKKFNQLVLVSPVFLSFFFLLAFVTNKQDKKGTIHVCFFFFFVVSITEIGKLSEENVEVLIPSSLVLLYSFFT